MRDKLAPESFVRDRGHRPALDGVRGVAILLVLGQHAPTRPLIDLRAFYRRRAARLCPALAAVVVVTTVVLLADRPDLRVGQVLAPAGAAATYTTSLFDWTNHVFATKDYFNYTWSLSVEEQFYLLWPVALMWGYRRGPRLFAALTLGLVALSLADDLYLGLSRAVKYDQHEYFGTDTNALPILAGCLLAITLQNGWLSGAVRRIGPAAPVAVVLLPVLGAVDQTYHPSLVIAAGSALTLVTLTGVVTRPRSLVAALLAGRPMRWLGERSYSIYLWNVLMRIAMLAFLGHTLLGDVAWVALFVVLAEVSFRYVERPLRARLAPRPHPARVPAVRPAPSGAPHG